MLKAQLLLHLCIAAAQLANMSGQHQRRQGLLLAVICYLAGISTGIHINVMQSSSNSVMDAMQSCCGGIPPRDVMRGSAMHHNGTGDRILITGEQTYYDDIDTTSGAPSDQKVNTSMTSSPHVHEMINFQEMVEYKGMIREMNNTITLENKKYSKIRESRQLPSLSGYPIYSEVVKEIIPEYLLPRYAKDFLQFPISRSLLRQSRTITGNTERLHLYLKKLQSQQCTTVLFLGGSVTKGHKAGGYINSYPKFFIDWLNARYPCMMVNGTLGKHQSKLTSSAAHSSQEIVVNWPVVNGIESFDLVLLEFNINDAFTPNNPHSLEDKGPVGETTEYRSGWYFEILLRRLLLLRKPDPVAIVTFSADYAGNLWADKSVAKWTKQDTQVNARKTLFRKNPEPVKAWISSLYEIPVFSATVWLLAIHSKKGIKAQFRRGSLLTTDAWHSGQECCHPLREGHLVLSLVLAYCVAEEEKFMLHHNDSDKIEREHDFTAVDKPVLRDPLYLSPEEDNMYVRNSIEVSQIDFTDPNGEERWKQLIVVQSGWTFYADNKDKDKFGFISNELKGKTHFAITITGGKMGLVELSYVMSYENFGDALVWITNPGTDYIGMTGPGSDQTQHQLCRNKQYFGTQQREDVDRLSGHWKEKVSIPTVTILKRRIQEGEQKTLHMCLLPKLESRSWKENKFKLLGVRVY